MQLNENAYQLDFSNHVVSTPIDFSENDQLYVHLFGSGFRAAHNVTVTVNGYSVPVPAFAPTEPIPRC